MEKKKLLKAIKTTSIQLGIAVLFWGYILALGFFSSNGYFKLAMFFLFLPVILFIGWMNYND